MKKHTELAFSSISEHGRWIASHARLPEAHNGSEDGPEQRWDFNLGWDGAIRMAVAGGNWAEGAKDMRAANIKTSATLRDVIGPDVDYSITGKWIDVAEYCAGEPEHWISDDDEQVIRIVRIGVSNFQSASVDSAAVLNRGAAILSIVDEIEKRGDRVELWSINDAIDRSQEAECNIKTLIKGSGDTWTPASAAFALCHPAFFRRIIFSTYERDNAHVGASRSGYGFPQYDKQSDSDFDLYFPCIGSRDQGEYSTPAKAMQTVLAIAEGEHVR